MRIHFYTHYFPPEVNAPATRTYEHGVRWAGAGHDVTIVTCNPNCPDGVIFPGYQNSLRPKMESVDGMCVFRVWTYLAANAGTARRIANYVSYLLSAVVSSFLLARPDVIVATTPQFFCAWAGLIVAKLRRVPFVLEVRDIWPESIEAVGAMKNRAILRTLQWMERVLYRSADAIVAVGQGYRENILGKADVGDRISVITNGVDLERFVPLAADPAVRQRWNLEGKFVCSYIGTIGMAHGLEIVIRAAETLRSKGRRDIAFFLVGDGAARERLERAVAACGLQDYVVFAGRQPKEEMPAILAASDACLVHLKKCELFGTVIPSKIFEIMAMEKPILMGVEGESRRMVAESGAGIDIEPESDAELVAAVERLADDPTLARRYASAARQYVAQNFNRDRLAAEYLELLKTVGGTGILPVTPKSTGDTPVPPDPAADHGSRTTGAAVR